MKPRTYREALLHFKPGSPRIRCYNFNLIIDINYEPLESFSAYIRSPAIERIIIRDTATVNIIDYNGELYHYNHSFHY